MELCAHCGKQFSNKSAFYRHLRNVHKIEPVIKNNLKCFDCDSVHKTYEQLRNHYVTLHSYEMFKEVSKFNTVDEFTTWKENVEKKMKCSYVKNSGAKCNGDNVKTYYVCHRSERVNDANNHLVKNSTAKTKKIKSQGLSKLPQSCPSTLELVYEAGKYTATLYSPHMGHPCTLRHINLTKLERKLIAGKISQGISFERILDDIRDSVKEDNNLGRIHLLDRHDLHNIKKEFSLEVDVKMHSNDAVSVDLWVESMKKLQNESPVLFYKAQGFQDTSTTFEKQDFILIIMTSFQKSQLVEYGHDKICIDSTHGTNSYDFLLTSVVVVDNFGAGIPVAFLLSNKTDTFTLSFFFKVIADKVGCITTRIFMSDDAPEFYNSWVNIMGETEHHLLCTWHVDRNWRKNLQKIQGDQEFKSKIYKYLRILLQEQDSEKFEEQLDFFNNELRNDPNTQVFGEYFYNYYSKRCQLWAYCYRKGLGINTNMYLEALHKNLKYIYLEGKKNKRIDKCISALIKLTRDNMIKQIKKNIKGKDSYRMKLIHTSHASSLNINNIVEVNTTSWKMKSSSSDNYYTVCKLSEVCVLKFCPLSCRQCKICIHDFSCNCPDFYIKVNICKHIHAVALHLNSPASGKSFIQEIHPQELVESVIHHNQQQHDYKNSSVRLKSKMDLLYGAISEGLDEEATLELEKTLDKALNIATKAKVSLTKNKEPANKKVCKQIRFEATKRKRSKSNFLKKPTDEEKTEFHEVFLKKYKIEHSYATLDV